MARQSSRHAPYAPATSRRQFLRSVAGLTAAATVKVQPSAAAASSKTASQAAPSTSVPLTALIFDDICKIHVPGLDARECPERYNAVLGALTKGGLLAKCQCLRPRAAADEELFACHSKGYVALARREIESGAARLSTGDTRVCRQSLKAARLAAGSACVAVDTVLRGQAKNAFCLTRPPGHHATPDRGMGFCIFNNVAIAARYAQRKHGVNKVLIVDWDVHHGNGTQDIFYDDPSVFYFSTHQSPWYPWTGRREETGRGRGLGTTLNWPMSPGAGRKEFYSAFEELAAVVGRYRPELVLVSAGFDARRGDPLGKLALTDKDFADLTALVLEVAREHCQGHVVSVLEGGYNLTGLARAAAAHVGRLQQG